VRRQIAFGTGAFHFPNPKAGLDQLSSYQATLTMTFEGLRLGRASRWSKTNTMLYSRQPAIWQLTIQKSGDLPDLDPIFMAERDGVAYERRGADPCTAERLQEGDSPGERIDLALFLSGVIGADLQEIGTFKGIAANRYSFDKRALGEQGPTVSSGEMWVASSGGYLVKYRLIRTGKADFFGEGIEGILNLDYELSEVNKPLTFTLPVNCSAGMVNAPLLPNAINVMKSAGMLTYTTPTSVADVYAFYQTQIPKLGWNAINEPLLTEDSAIIDYEQGDQQMSIFISREADVTTVDIMLWIIDL
jgi:hypothetical protein